MFLGSLPVTPYGHIFQRLLVCSNVHVFTLRINQHLRTVPVYGERPIYCGAGSQCKYAVCLPLAFRRCWNVGKIASHETVGNNWHPRTGYSAVYSYQTLPGRDCSVMALKLAYAAANGQLRRLRRESFTASINSTVWSEWVCMADIFAEVNNIEIYMLASTWLLI